MAFLGNHGEVPVGFIVVECPHVPHGSITPIARQANHVDPPKLTVPPDAFGPRSTMTAIAAQFPIF